MLSQRYRPKVLPKVPKRTRTQRSCAATARRRAIELPIAARNRRTTTKDSRRVRRKATAKEQATSRSSNGKCYKCGKTGHMSEDCRSKESRRAKKASAETGCIDMASIDFNAVEIGAVQVLGKDHQIRTGIDSCAAVTVFPKTVADDYPMLQTPGKAQSYRPASGRLLPDLGARRVQVKLKDGSLRYVNPRLADTHRALMAVSEMSDMGHDVFFPRSDRGMKACAYHEGSGTKLEVTEFFELPVELVPYSQGTTRNSNSGTYSSPALEQIRGHDGQGLPRQTTQIDRCMQCRMSHGRSSIKTRGMQCRRVSG